MKYLMIMTIMVLMAASVAALEVQNPLGNYYDNNIPINLVSNEAYENITYSIDSEQYILACNNCSNFSTTRNITNGNHTFSAKAILNNLEKQATTTFAVAALAQPLPQQLFLAVETPQNKTYTNKVIWLKFSTNIKSNITYNLDNKEYVACNNCRYFSKYVELKNGTYNLTVNANSGNLTDYENINFLINLTKYYPKPESPKNHTYEKDYKNLPELLVAGKITDNELASIIRTHKLKTNVLNKLIKTGKLGEESIRAIIETQFKPRGILKKLFRHYDYDSEDYVYNILRHYNLSTNLEQKILQRDDISDDDAKKIQDHLKIKEKEKKNEDHKNKKSYQAGKQNGNHDD